MASMLRITYLLLLFLAWPTAASAAPRWFDLEVLVFARDGMPRVNEKWPEFPELPDTTKARAPASGSAPRRLSNSADRLRRQPGHTVLLHTAWRQPVGSQKRAPWIRLTDAPDATTAATLDGMVRLSVRRYLHLDLDLVVTREVEVAITEEPITGTVAIPLAEPAATPATVTTPGAAPAPAVTYSRVRLPFRMIDSRRMRSDEVHYVDHPAFGVLVLATAYHPPVPAEPAAAAIPTTVTGGEGDAAAKTPAEPSVKASGTTPAPAAATPPPPTKP